MNFRLEKDQIQRDCETREKAIASIRVVSKCWMRLSDKLAELTTYPIGQFARLERLAIEHGRDDLLRRVNCAIAECSSSIAELVIQLTDFPRLESLEQLTDAICGPEAGGQ